jgi:putative peptidoglycan lipid II flippase
MIPGTLGVAAFQINVLVTQIVAFKVDPQIIASFDYAVRLMELPQGMFGISLATFLLPALAGFAAEKNFGEFRATLRQGLGTLVFANLIASVLLVVLAEPILRLLFERGEFTAGSTGRAAFALVWLAPGLITFSAVNILARAFYAVGDTSTPMKIGVVCLAMNLIFAVALIPTLRQGGMAIANTATSFFNAGLLLFALRKKLGRLDMQPVIASLPQLGLAGLAGGAAAWGCHHYWSLQLGHSSLALKLGEVFVPAAAGGLIYWGIAFATRVPAAREITELIARRFQKTNEQE